jgi:putative FmdB family regulatory protein
MPIYEYTCQGCSSDFELLVRGQEQPECPDCGGHRLEKKLSVPAAHVSSGASLPVCAPPSPGGGCGLPQCGSGGCMGM